MSQAVGLSSRSSASVGPGPIRVASVPSSHVYVRHLTSEGSTDDGLGVERLPDPRADGASAQSTWWPPAMLEPGWVAANARSFDVFHLHFGFDACSPGDLGRLVSELRAARKPFVFTVHDLRNPHHADRRLHDAQLDVLVPAADELVTLTEGAAREIERRWRRHATVVPHPHVVDLTTAAQVRRARSAIRAPFRVGLHVKSLRACMDAETVLPGLVRAVQELPDAVLQVNGHRDVLEPGGAHFDRSLADLLERLGADIDLRVHDFFSDTELWGYLGSLDASVLPYRHGTHSGWLEACRDLGTDVIAPDCGYYADQAPVHSYSMDESSFDEDSLVAAVHRAHDRPRSWIDLEERRRQRDAIAATPQGLYSQLVRS